MNALAQVVVADRHRCRRGSPRPPLPVYAGPAYVQVTMQRHRVGSRHTIDIRVIGRCVRNLYGRTICRELSVIKHRRSVRVRVPVIESEPLLKSPPARVSSNTARPPSTTLSFLARTCTTGVVSSSITSTTAKEFALRRQTSIPVGARRTTCLRNRFTMSSSTVAIDNSTVFAPAARDATCTGGKPVVTMLDEICL